MPPLSSEQQMANHRKAEQLRLEDKLNLQKTPELPASTSKPAEEMTPAEYRMHQIAAMKQPAMAQAAPTAEPEAIKALEPAPAAVETTPDQLAILKQEVVASRASYAAGYLSEQKRRSKLQTVRQMLGMTDDSAEAGKNQEQLAMDKARADADFENYTREIHRNTPGESAAKAQAVIAAILENQQAFEIATNPARSSKTLETIKKAAGAWAAIPLPARIALTASLAGLTVISTGGVAYAAAVGGYKAGKSLLFSKMVAPYLVGASLAAAGYLAGIKTAQYRAKSEQQRQAESFKSFDSANFDAMRKSLDEQSRLLAQNKKFNRRLGIGLSAASVIAGGGGLNALEHLSNVHEIFGAIPHPPETTVPPSAEIPPSADSIGQDPVGQEEAFQPHYAVDKSTIPPTTSNDVLEQEAVFQPHYDSGNLTHEDLAVQQEAAFQPHYATEPVHQTLSGDQEAAYRTAEYGPVVGHLSGDYVVKLGDNLTKILEGKLASNTAFEKLSLAQQHNVVANIIEDIKGNPDNLKEIGITSGKIEVIHQNDTLHLDKIDGIIGTHKHSIDSLVAHASTLPVQPEHVAVAAEPAHPATHAPTHTVSKLSGAPRVYGPKDIIPFHGQSMTIEMAAAHNVEDILKNKVLGFGFSSQDQVIKLGHVPLSDAQAATTANDFLNMGLTTPNTLDALKNQIGVIGRMARSVDPQFVASVPGESVGEFLVRANIAVLEKLAGELGVAPTGAAGALDHVQSMPVSEIHQPISVPVAPEISHAPVNTESVPLGQVMPAIPGRPNFTPMTPPHIGDPTNVG